jgi:hypothetical protein
MGRYSLSSQNKRFGDTRRTSNMAKSCQYPYRKTVSLSIVGNNGRGGVGIPIALMYQRRLPELPSVLAIQIAYSLRGVNCRGRSDLHQVSSPQTVEKVSFNLTANDNQPELMRESATASAHGRIHVSQVTVTSHVLSFPPGLFYRSLSFVSPRLRLRRGPRLDNLVCTGWGGASA